MVKVSVIVPVYNAEQYLSRCIDSILAQKFTDYELILVNDGSTDGSLAICQSYSDKDFRVIVCNQPNRGASSARNHGIDVSKGDYICFVDADDDVNENYLSHLYQDMVIESNIDLVLHGLNRVIGETKKTITFNETRIYSLDEGSFFKDVKLYNCCGPVCKLFKRRIVRDHEIYFLESINHGEDFDFFAKYLQYCDCVYVSKIANYFYIINDKSLSHKYLSFQDESSCLFNLSCGLTNLCHHFQNAALERQVNDYLAFYISKVLFSIYEPPMLNLPMRVKNLKSIEKTYGKIYRDYYVPTTRSNRILKYLFVSKFYRIFDFANVLRKIKQEKF